MVLNLREDSVDSPFFSVATSIQQGTFFCCIENFKNLVKINWTTGLILSGQSSRYYVKY
jgi:hypothetical protein